MNDSNQAPVNYAESQFEQIVGLRYSEIVLEEEKLKAKNEEKLSKAAKITEKGDESPKPSHSKANNTSADEQLQAIKHKVLWHVLKRSRIYANELAYHLKGKKATNVSENNSEDKNLKSGSLPRDKGKALVNGKCIKKRSRNKESDGSKKDEEKEDKEKEDKEKEDKEKEDKKKEDEENKVNLESDDFDFFRKTRITSKGFIVSEYQPLLVEGGVMKDYQLRGLQWMITLFTNGVNGILADEMGLGKTLQVISLICELIEKGISGPFLIIAPLSTLGNWISEFCKFAPAIPTLLFHGTKNTRKSLIPAITESFMIMGRKMMRVVITSYEVAMFEKRNLSKIDWIHITVDEGHRIKNHNSLLSKTLRGYNSVGKLLLTGTPLQNNLCELWSLLNFIIPELFKSLEVFKLWFNVDDFIQDGVKFMEEDCVLNVINTIQQILMPFLLRREKKKLSVKLPPKKEILVYCPMTALQKILYESTIDRSIEYLLRPKRGNKNLSEPLPKKACILFKNLQSNVDNEQYLDEFEKYKQKYYTNEYCEEEYDLHIQLRNPAMQLRKIVNHPYLIQYPLVPGTNELKIDEDLVKTSGKLLVVDALLSRLKVQGHKVVIFSNFKEMLDIIGDLAYLRNYRYYRMDGSSKQEDRQESIYHFNNNPDIFLFLVSMRSGGLGINLTGADTIIIYDSDWNPQINLQCQDRCHRIGQKNPVLIYKLCVRGTIDERIIERGNAKRKLEKMIIQKGKFTRGVADSDYSTNVTDLKELKELLQSTDYDDVVHSNGSVLTEEELEALLDRSEMKNDSDSENEDSNETGFEPINSETNKFSPNI